MDFELSEEQRQLADSVGRYLSDHYDFESRKKIVRSDTGSSDGVWRQLAEFGVLALGFVAYMMRTAPTSRLGAAAPWGFIAVLAIMAAVNWLGPTPPSSIAVALSALAVYVVTAVLAAGIDRVRVARAAVSA